jgi:nucleoside-diphosphate-sugar epimerase
VLAAHIQHLETNNKIHMDVVTGSFGYIGKYITQELISSGKRVKTITTHPDKPNPFGNDVKAYPYNFDNPELLFNILEGCETLFNTYWVRFNYGKSLFEKALRNTKILFDSAKKAEIKKIVHISVTNPSESDALPYYRGKALQEKMLKELGISYSIIRPTLVFGKEDILLNNIAWTIRRFPFVPIFGSGDYKVQPVFVEDLALIAVECAKKNTSETLDAIGPETFTYTEMLRVMASMLNPDIKLIHVWPNVGIFLGKIIGLFVNDVILTKDELKGLMLNKLTSQQTPNGKTKFTEWLKANKGTVGERYTSELDRHFRWRRSS